MISLLNTRPQPQALTQAIEQAWPAQVRVIEAPLQKLVSLPLLPEPHQQFSWQTADIWVFVSANAVAFFHHALQAQDLSGPPPSVALVAVGQATWQALADLNWSGLQPLPASFDSEGMLALPVFNQVANKAIGIVRGEVGRDWLAEQLNLRGARVSFYPVYRREALPLDVSAWQTWLAPIASNQACVSCNSCCYWVLLTSQENALIWWQHYQAWCQSHPQTRELGVLSLTANVAQCLSDCGFKGQQRVCENASQSSMLKQLSQILGDSLVEERKS
ncbi:uroporphyrinogen-III synthase [Thiomicrospira cyclica]|uniref:Uroporphyrinogen-III synthase n=1 Tax=Thiomicrospira cyclica (strain DSM 14477 / JCM 11371 / ALM1) TaxID=717773 RepID=F6DBI5_THICA|nr:uroporphyrinogen-III synthase [Thiomicrospira cyclica]AEG32387.1 Uroporphyrinogen III synthase HEM4 [Thiomicrospira cyclica ALM1]